MAWLFNREEKGQYVMQTYEENRSIREIAKLMQMSLRDIGIIINKVKAKTERQREHIDEEEIHDIRRKSKESHFSNCISATNTIAINIKSRQRFQIILTIKK